MDNQSGKFVDNSWHTSKNGNMKMRNTAKPGEPMNIEIQQTFLGLFQERLQVWLDEFRVVAEEIKNEEPPS